VFDLLVRNGKVVDPRGVRELDVAVSGETIAALGAPGTLDGAVREIDAGGCYVLPGAIDPHTHYGSNVGRLDLEDAEWTWGAAFGGTTTIVDFAKVPPPSTIGDALAARTAQLDGRTAVDWGLHVILMNDFSFEVLEEIGEVIRAGYPTIKTYMTYAGMTDDGRRYGAMIETAEHGGMAVVHAEDDAIARFLTEKYVREGKTHGAYICEVRGSLVEEAAVRRALLLAERAGAPLYILHMAAEAGIVALAESRARGVPCYGETLSLYLHFTQEDMWDENPIEVNGNSYPRGVIANNYPTPKQPSDREACWRALADGRLQTVATDHAGMSLATRFEQMGHELPFPQAGQMSAELRVPLLFHHGVNAGRISVERLVELVSSNPAKLTGLWPRKGQVAVGSDADIVVFDPAKRWTVRADELHSRDTWNLWEGYELEGKVRTTVLRGQVLVENENWVGSRTAGRFQPRQIAPEVRAGNLGFTAESFAAAGS
jgi:dihydropyrimidinase